MVAAALVDVPISDGEALLRELDKASISVPVAFWRYSSEWGEWRLALASPIVDSEGPREMYRRVQGALERLPQTALRVDHVWAVGTKNPLVRALRSAIRTVPGMTGIRVTGSIFDGQLFEDAYIYRSV